MHGEKQLQPLTGNNYFSSADTDLLILRFGFMIGTRIATVAYLQVFSLVKLCNRNPHLSKKVLKRAFWL